MRRAIWTGSAVFGLRERFGMPILWRIQRPKTSGHSRGLTMKLVYVAGPYRCETEYGVLLNIQEAERLAMRVWLAGGSMRLSA